MKKFNRLLADSTTRSDFPKLRPLQSTRSNSATPCVQMPLRRYPQTMAKHLREHPNFPEYPNLTILTPNASPDERFPNFTSDLPPADLNLADESDAYGRLPNEG